MTTTETLSNEDLAKWTAGTALSLATGLAVVSAFGTGYVRSLGGSPVWEGFSPNDHVWKPLSEFVGNAVAVAAAPVWVSFWQRLRRAINSHTAQVPLYAVGFMGRCAGALHASRSAAAAKLSVE
jgi:hypothetical protein